MACCCPASRRDRCARHRQRLPWPAPNSPPRPAPLPPPLSPAPRTGLLRTSSSSAPASAMGNICSSVAVPASRSGYRARTCPPGPLVASPRKARPFSSGECSSGLSPIHGTGTKGPAVDADQAMHTGPTLGLSRAESALDDLHAHGPGEDVAREASGRRHGRRGRGRRPGQDPR